MSLKHGTLRLVATACALLAGCVPSARSPAPSKDVEILAPLLGEPCYVRVVSPKVTLISLSESLAAGETTQPKPMFRFIAVGFPIGVQQAFAVDNYSVGFGKNETRLPFAVGGDNPAAPDLFYDPDELAEVVQVAKGPEEKNGVNTQDQDLGPLMVSWTTPASILLLLFEVPADAKDVELRHGKRTFKLSPNHGRIDSKLPAASPSEARPAPKAS